jgi:hypothetical protein
MGDQTLADVNRDVTPVGTDGLPIAERCDSNCTLAFFGIVPVVIDGSGVGVSGSEDPVALLLTITVRRCVVDPRTKMRSRLLR